MQEPEVGLSLATKWSQLNQIKQIGVWFFLVKEDGEIIEK